LNYSTGVFHSFSATVEMEDSRSAGVNDYNDTVNGNKSVYSVIADPETTELDQTFIQYKENNFKVKLGRQLLALDTQRFVGHVGWRQDRQVFDGLSLNYQPKDKLSLNYAYIKKRNRIFAELKDLFSKDHLFNASYDTALGKVTGYGYFLELDNNTDNSLDTVGLSFKGAKKLGDTKWLYSAEWATQDAAKHEADYSLLEAGLVVSAVTIKLGYEVLGSDSGQYGFSTPLATLHKFNGWSDQFLATPVQGLEDRYLSLSGKLAGGKWVVVYHDFSAEKSSASIDDFGSEINLLYAKTFAKHYSTGIKYARYSAGDVVAGKVDTDKLWVWAGLSF